MTATLGTWQEDERHAAASAALQLWGGMDPDGARWLAQTVVRAILRAGLRPTDGLPTDDEVRRARVALMRRGHDIERDAIYAALFDALTLDPPEALTDSECGICRLEGPNDFGAFDLIEDPDCPMHGAGS